MKAHYLGLHQLYLELREWSIFIRFCCM